ncbi:MAG: acetate kinase, partial [Solirubrobacteraceae bacterium]|nr:acetate kinase [Solirubrobacteraceae bacterium]
MRVLVVNAGSSSLKLSLLDGRRSVAAQNLPAERGLIDPGDVERAVAGLGAVDAVGHRIVHGGARYRQAVRVDAEVVRGLGELSALAPLHQAKSLAALTTVSRVLADVPSVACFDTAFHATLPPAAYTYALPPAWCDR